MSFKLIGMGQDSKTKSQTTQSKGFKLIGMKEEATQKVALTPSQVKNIMQPKKGFESLPKISPEVLNAPNETLSQMGLMDRFKAYIDAVPSLFTTESPVKTAVKKAASTLAKSQEAPTDPNVINQVDNIGGYKFGTNIMPVKKDDNIFEKAGKSVVNFAAGIPTAGLNFLNAPGEALRQSSIQTDSLIKGEGLKPFKQTSFLNDIVLSDKGKQAFEEYKLKHPNIASVAEMLADMGADPTTWLGGGGIISEANKAKMAEQTTKGLISLADNNAKILSKIKSSLNDTKTETTLPLQNIIKPTTQQGKFKLANPEYDAALNDYNEAIKTIQNHFGTNELRSSEIPLIKSQLGIDLNSIVNRLEETQHKTLSSAEDLRIKRVVGVASNKVYNATTKASKLPNNSLNEVLNAQKQETLRNNMFIQPDTAFTPNTTGNAPDVLTSNKIASSIDSKNTTFKSKLDTLYQKTVNNEQAITNTDKNTGIVATNASKAGGTVSHIVHEKVVDMAGKPLTSKSLNDTVYVIPKEQRQAYSDYLKQKSAGNVVKADNLLKNNPAIKAQADFDDYLLNLHNIDRFKNGNPIWDGVNDTMSQQRVSELNAIHPEFAARAKEVTDTINSLEKSWGVKSGLIEDGLHEGLKGKYKNYVPTYNVTTAHGDQFYNSVLSPGKIIKKATGFGDTIISPTEGIAILTNKLIKSSRKNEVYQSLLKAVRENPSAMGKKGIAEIIPANELEKIHNDKVGQELNQKILEGGIDEALKISDNALSVDPKGGYFLNVMEHGKPVKLSISEDLYKGFESMGKMDDSDLHKFLGTFKKYATNPFKSLITGYNPLFALRNVVRDVPTAYIQGTENNLFKFAKNIGSATKGIIKKSPEWEAYKALGGQGADFYNIEKGIKPTGFGKKALETIGVINKFTEDVPRFGEYLGTLKRGETQQQALFNAGEVTTNFGRHGNFTKAIDAVVPYLNPAVQGADKFIRTLKDRPIQTIKKALEVVTIPTAGFYALNQLVDKQGYDQLDNRTKDTYFLIPVGNGKFIKIPKTREAGVLFGALFERIARQVSGGEDAWKGFVKQGVTNFVPNNPISSNFLSPLINASTKTGTDFAGRDIVPKGLQGLSPQYQYDAQSTETAKWFANLVNKMPDLPLVHDIFKSPKKIDYIIKSYGGIIASLTQPLMVNANYSNGKGNKIKALTGSFTADSLFNNDLQNTFYNNLDKMATENADAKFTGNDGRTNLSAGMTKASGDMATLRAIIKQIESDPNMTASEKQIKSRDYQQQILDIAKRSNDLFKEGDNTLNSKFPEINGQYYPDNQFTFNKKKVILNPSQYEEYKKLVNDSFMKIYDRIKNNKYPSEEARIKAIDSARGSVEDAAKRKIMLQGN